MRDEYYLVLDVRHDYILEVALGEGHTEVAYSGALQLEEYSVSTMLLLPGKGVPAVFVQPREGMLAACAL